MKLAFGAAIVLLAASAVGTAHADFYAGVQGGYLTSRSHVTIPAYTPQQFTLDSHGGEGGIFAGFTMPIGPKWSFSIEADFNGTNADGTRLSGGCCGEHYRIDQKWNGSLRAMFGFSLAPTTEVFASAGWRMAHVDDNYIPVGAIQSTDLNGYVLGVGLKQMIASDWFIRGEYRYSHASSESQPLLHSSIDLTSNEALAGVGFNF